MKRILIIQGHRDSTGNHFGYALASAYEHSAVAKDHVVRTIEVAKLNFCVLRRRMDWNVASMSDDIKSAQADLPWADHIVLIFPLWQGTMPALLKAFLENTLCEYFKLRQGEKGSVVGKRLKGKSAHVVATIGMPAICYRLFYRAPGIKNQKK